MTESTGAGSVVPKDGWALCTCGECGKVRRVRISPFEEHVFVVKSKGQANMAAIAREWHLFGLLTGERWLCPDCEEVGWQQYADEIAARKEE